MNVLIAYDGSEHADAALRDLALAGLPPRANALVLSVVDAWLPGESRPGGKADDSLPGLKDIRASIGQRIDEQRKVAEHGASRLREMFPEWTVTADACADSPAAAIIARAEGGSGADGSSAWRADLTVVGSRGHGAVRRLLLGSVAQKVLHGLRGVLRIARGAVPTTPVSSTDPAAGGRGSGAPWPPRIVVGVDGSPDSHAAVEVVAGRDWPAGTQVLVACYAQGIAGLEHSNAATVSGFAGGGIWSGDATGPGGPVESWATDAVARAASIIRGGCPGVGVSTVVRCADPTYALVDEAANWGGRAGGGTSDGRGADRRGADCIFVGARGVRGLERLLLGSVSSAVAMNAHCSVEIVHARGSTRPSGT